MIRQAISPRLAIKMRLNMLESAPCPMSVPVFDMPAAEFSITMRVAGNKNISSLRLATGGFSRNILKLETKDAIWRRGWLVVFQTTISAVEIVEA
jgi:hypothetical protein